MASADGKIEIRNNDASNELLVGSYVLPAGAAVGVKPGKWNAIRTTTPELITASCQLRSAIATERSSSHPLGELGVSDRSDLSSTQMFGGHRTHTPTV